LYSLLLLLSEKIQYQSQLTRIIMIRICGNRTTEVNLGTNGQSFQRKIAFWKSCGH